MEFKEAEEERESKKSEHKKHKKDKHHKSKKHSKHKKSLIRNSDSTTSEISYEISSSSAILNIEKNGDVIRFVTKADANVSATITNIDGTATYNLNFGDKSKVNITQKK